MLINSERFTTAFLGALIALILKAIYDWNQERKRRKDIKQMIKLDLEDQVKGVERIISDYGKIQMYIREQSFKVFLNEIDKTSRVNTNVFKSHTYRDYYKSFDLNTYKGVLSFYEIIEKASNETVFNNLNDYNEGKAKAEERTGEEIVSFFDNMFLLMMDAKIEYYNSVKGDLVDFIKFIQ